MSRTPVQTMIDKVKRRVDYNITDPTGLDVLLLDCLNDALKVMRQKLFDRGINIEIGGSATLLTTASQSYIDLSLTPSACVAALAGLGAGSVNSGTHSYKVTFVTADGESDVSSASNVVTTAAGDGQVALTALPISKSSEVTARKIYRTSAGGSTYKLLATISDNTTLVYADNIADSSLGVNAPTINTMPSYSDIIRVSERVNYKVIEVIPYQEFVKKYPDPTAFSSVTPDHCAVWNNRLYIGPTPSATGTAIYVEHIKHLNDLALTGNLPYENDYDPLLLAMTRLEYMYFYDSKDRVAIKTVEERVLQLVNDLIISAKNVGQNNQVLSRREETIFGPRTPASVSGVGP